MVTPVSAPAGTSFSAAWMTPVMVDVDGVRFYRWTTFGIQRLLRSMREHRQYTPADSLALCRGYAPFTRIDRELADAPAEEGTPT